MSERGPQQGVVFAHPVRWPRWLLLALLIAFVAMYFRSAAPGRSAAAGLVAAYAFDEGSGSTVADLSGKGNTGTLNGAAWTTAGRYGKALAFDGTSSFVDLGNPASLRITGSMTWSAWVFATANPPDDGQIVAKSSDGGGWQFKSSPDTGPHTFGVAVSINGGSNVQRYSTTVRQLNTWYYVAGVYNAQAQTLDIYVNGVLDDGVLRGTVPASQFDANQNVTIGRRAGGTGYYFQGTIDELRIYNRALTAAEVAADMTTPVDQQGPDVEPPTAPGAPAAAPMSAGRMDVSWNPATDNNAVASYQLERCAGAACTNFGQIAVPAVTSFSDTGVTASTTYRYRVRAVDAAGTPGPYSPVSTATTVSGASAFANDVVVQNLNFVPAMRFLPGGKMLMAEIGGTLRVVQPGATQPDTTPFLVIPNAVAVADAGTHDLTLDPNFATNHYIYVFYEHAIGSSYRDTVSRFTAAADLNSASPSSEVVLWQDDAPTIQDGHHGASLAFGPDGKLYISTGDNDQPPDSQSLSSYHGKILRVNPDGSIPSDNPFIDGPGGNKDQIWAYGLRNPYRMTFEPTSGRLYVGDVGGNIHATSVEELDLVVRGANYGWPLCDGGPCGAPGVTNPVYSYAHSGRDAAIMGGFFYTGTQYPAGFQGSYFFADYAQNWLKRITFDSTGTVVTGVFNFQPPDGTLDSPTVGDPVQLQQGPDGSLYYLDLSFDEQGGSFNAGTLRRVRFLGSTNQPPTVAASASPLQGLAPLDVTFSSTGTSDPEGDPLSYSWAFGDGGTSTQSNPTHTYTASGQYTATLTVSDGTQTAFKSLNIIVGNPPVGRILTPSNGAIFRAGQTIAISGDATDVEDGTLPDSAFSWTVIFHHDTHVHPGIGPVVGVRSLNFAIPDTGHDFAGNTSYEIILKVTDSTGLQHSSSVFIYPDKVNVAFATVPSGLNVELGGITRQTPFVYDGLKGFRVTVNAPAQVANGTSYAFASWSDGGSQSHEYVVPDADGSLTATFQQAAAPPPVAAYGFEEGAGTAIGDASGNGNIGTINGATWTNTGKYGKALVFNGTSNYVDLGNQPSLRITGSMTWSAWVFATGNPPDDGQIVAKSSGGGGTGGWQFKSSPDTGPHTFGIGVSIDGSSNVQRYSTTVRQLNTWYYVTGVYNAQAQTLDIYVNGVLDNGVLRGAVPASQFDPNQNVTIGRRTGGFYFKGTIDEVRIYNRALTAAQIQADMATPVTPAGPDKQPPTAPTSLAAIVTGQAQINLNWTASTDNVGVTGYGVERCQGVGCSNFTQIATPAGASYNDTGLTAGTSYSYRVRAVDAAGNQSGYSNIITATTAAQDTQAPTAPGSLTATAANSSQVNLLWTASIDNIGVTGYQVERCQGVGCSNFTQIATPAGASYNDTGLAPSTSYSYRVRAVDAAGNQSPYSGVSTASTQAGPSGLVAAYSFNEGTGTTLTDRSGNAINGTINGATWTNTGKYGKALVFNGTSNYVNLGNPVPLRITGSMTWSAWLFATGNPPDDGQIVAKSSGGGGTGGWQFKSSPDTGPHTFGIGVSIDGSSNVQRYSTTVRQLNTWYYVTGVYNAQAQTLDIYVNGVLDNGVLRGAVPASQFDPNQNVTIGRRTGGFYFKGTIDEVRIYNRALTATQIQADMNTPVG